MPLDRKTLASESVGLLQTYMSRSQIETDFVSLLVLQECHLVLVGLETVLVTVVGKKQNPPKYGANYAFTEKKPELPDVTVLTSGHGSIRLSSHSGLEKQPSIPIGCRMHVMDGIFTYILSLKSTIKCR